MADADVLVVGTGPAGGMAAWMAAKEGAKVVVVDRKKVVGEPVRCAEGTFSSLLSLFDLHEGKWISNHYNTAVIKHKGMKDIRVSPKTLRGVSLDRVLFEQEICRRAKEEGAEIVLGKSVVSLQGGEAVLEDGTSISARVVVGADGVESMIGRWAGMLEPLGMDDIASAVQYVMEDGDWKGDTAEMILGREEAPNGYIWIFPKSDKRANVGAVTTPSTGKNAKTLLDDFIASRLSGAKTVSKTCGCVPVAPPLSKVVKDNVVLVGDSARFASAFGAGGIHSAMFSGAVAGRLSARCAYTKDLKLLEEYDHIMKKSLYKNLMRSYRIKTRTYGSDKGMKRTLRLFRIGGKLITHIPIDPMGFWWGRLDKYVR